MIPEHYTDSAILFLRRMAGRLQDDTLNSLWNDLGAGEFEYLEDTIFGSLEHEGVGVTHSEARVLRSLLDDPEDARMQTLDLLPSEPDLLYSFSMDGGGEIADEFAAAAAEAEPDVLRTLRVRREPNSEASPCPAAWIYLFESAAESYIPHVRLALAGQFVTTYRYAFPVEVFGRREELPHYYEAALAAAREV
ncbi:hypothetical protein ACWGR4_12290 [Embleya sp. NPDC055664]